ncbi:MAG: hypothetical protein LBG83_06030 [Oscillospiraceae bacterium]|nr:hypothetical protein [Oscillospiraceae bacterium]
MAELRRRRTHRWAFPLGMALVALAVVGLVALGRMAANGVQDIRENPKDKLEYEKFLSSIIVFDPDPFDSVESMPDKNVPQLLSIALWSILRDDSNKPEDIAYDDNGSMIVTRKQVENRYQRLFGALPPRHATLEVGEMEFTYDQAREVYLIPATGSFELYTPSVRMPAKKTGSQIELIVDYLYFNDFEMDERGRRVLPPKPSKTMVITLFEVDDGSGGTYYRVGSIRQPTGIDVAVGQTAIA